VGFWCYTPTCFALLLVTLPVESVAVLHIWHDGIIVRIPSFSAICYRTSSPFRRIFRCSFIGHGEVAPGKTLDRCVCDCEGGLWRRTGEGKSPWARSSEEGRTNEGVAVAQHSVRPFRPLPRPGVDPLGREREVVAAGQGSKGGGGRDEGRRLSDSCTSKCATARGSL